MKRLIGMLAVLLAVSLAGCASDPPPPMAAGGAGAAVPRVYHIGPGDHLKVDVWKQPELSEKVPVRPDGRISMPLIGDVHVGGKTPSAVGTEIQQKLATYIRDPRVTVVVEKLGGQQYESRVRVTGAVAHPSSLDYRNGMTVLDAVLDAGGVNKFAAPSRAKLYRLEPDGKTKVYDLRLDKILNDGDLASNVTLQPGDVIAVPQRLF